METAFPERLANSSRFSAYAAMVVTSEVDAGYVSDRRQEIKEHLKEIEATRKSFTEPLLEAKRRIDDEAKRISIPLQAIVSTLDQKLIAWHRSQEQVRIEAERQRREEEAKKLTQEREAQLRAVALTNDEKAGEAIVQIDTALERLEQKPIQIQQNTRTAKSTTYLQERWTFEIEDVTKIPREFLLVDEVKLGRYAVAMKEQAIVPGVKFYKKASIGGKK